MTDSFKTEHFMSKAHILVILHQGKSNDAKNMSSVHVLK